MFEEEAKRSLEEIRSESWFSKSYSNGYERGFQDGAEFGYNKANEWHDLRKDSNDLPDNGKRVLVKDKSRRGYDVACLCRSKSNSDFWSYERFISRVSDNYIIAWCKLPKFEE